MLATVNLKRIPQFVAASSPKGLVQAMLKNNFRYGLEFQYFDIQNSGGKWYAWFYLEIDRNIVEEKVKKAGK
jgi:hypothetical protein